MIFIFTDHLKTRLKQRVISPNLVKEVCDKDEENYWDNLRDHHITVSMVLYKSKYRKALVAYDKIEKDSIEVITIHPITDEQIKQRLNSGRWSYEKKQN